MEIGNKIMKHNWKLRIFSMILIGLLYVGLMLLTDYLFDDKFQSLKSYLFQGVFFGILMELGSPYVNQKFGTKFISRLVKKITPELTQDEEIEYEGSANLFCGIESVGGKLFLTNKNVIFKSHKLNIQKGQTNIDYHHITEVNKRKTANLINNGIRIKTNNGKEYDLVVHDREKWIEKLKEKIK